MPSETVTIVCSSGLARKLGVMTCDKHELSERGIVGFRNFRIVCGDAPDGLCLFWKWPVVRPVHGGEFLYP
jgi:hypothetical protein